MRIAVLVLGVVTAISLVAVRNVGTVSPKDEYLLVRRHVELGASDPIAKFMGTPKVEFGSLPPQSQMWKKFVVENIGDSPLMLSNAHGTRDCVTGKILNSVIQPGATGVIELGFTVVAKGPLFRESLIVETNDPTREKLEIPIRGIIEYHVRPTVGTVKFDRTPPGETSVAEFFMVSKDWSDFEIVSAECTHPEMEVLWQPATESELKEYAMVAGHKFVVGLPDNLPRGKFQEFLTIRTRNAKGEEEELDVPITGSVLRRLAIYGPSITTDGVVELERVGEGEGTKCVLTAKVRDNHTRLAATQIQTEPGFLEVSFEPASSTNTGLYRLEVAVPKDAPPGNFLDHNQGKLTIDFDHPRISQLELGVHFAVFADED